MSFARMQQRRDSTANWARLNPILLDGEMGIDSDLDRYKLGDGVTRWNTLPFSDGVAVDAATRAEAAAVRAETAEAGAGGGGTAGPDPTKADLVSGRHIAAQLYPGTRLTAVWSSTASRYEDLTGFPLSTGTRPFGRSDVLWDLIGGPPSGRPTWAGGADLEFAAASSGGGVSTLPPAPALARLTITPAGMVQKAGVNYRSGGINAFQLISNDYPTNIARDMTRVEIDSLLDKALALKVGVVRSHTLAASVGNANTLVQGVSGTGSNPTIVYDQSVWDVIDYAAYAARVRGIYLLPPFVDELGYYHGGKRHWVNFRRPGTVSLDYSVKSANSQVQRAAENFFYTDQQINWDFEKYLSDWLNHVSSITGLANKNEPVFSVLQIGNELWTAAQDAPGWVAGKAAKIKSLAPNCLIMDSGTDGLVVEDMAWASPDIDILETHPYTVFTPVEVERQAKFAASVGKGFAVMEYPWSKSSAPTLEDTVRRTGNIFTSSLWSLQNDADLHNAGVGYGGDDASFYVPGKTATEQAAVSRVTSHHQFLITNAASATPPPIPQQGIDNFDYAAPPAAWDNDKWRVYEPTLEGGISFGNWARLVSSGGTTRGRLHLRQAGGYDVSTYIAPASRAPRVLDHRTKFNLVPVRTDQEAYLRVPIRSQYLLGALARRTCYFVQIGMEVGGLAFIHPGKMVENVETLFLPQAIALPTYAVGVPITIEFSAIGSSLSLSVNGVVKWTGTDTTPALAVPGFTGFELRGGNAVNIVEVDIDTWSLNDGVFDGGTPSSPGAGQLDGGSPDDAITLPTPPAPTAVAGDQQIALATTDYTDGSVTIYRWYRNGVLVGNSAVNTFTDIGLTNGTAYTHTVSLGGPTGASLKSASSPATIPATQADITPPDVPNVPTAVAGNGEVVVSVSGSAADVTQWRWFRAGTTLVGTTTVPTFTDTGLTNGTAYTYKVGAGDVAGNFSPRSPLSAPVTPVSPSDITPPATPVAPVATAGALSVSLTATPPFDANGVTTYRWFRGGVLRGTTTTASFTETGLPAGTPVQYKVGAGDAAGNFSPQSPLSNAVTPTAGTTGSTSKAIIGMSALPENWDSRMTDVQGAGRIKSRRIFCFFESGGRSKAALIERAIADGMIPVLSYKHNPNGGAGPNDEWVLATANYLASLDTEIITSYHHEPLNDFGATGQPTVAEYNRRTQAYLPVLKRGKVKTATLLNGWVLNYRINDFTKFLPAASLALMDYAGMDTYQAGSDANPGTPWPGSRIPLLKTLLNNMGYPNMQIIIGEYNGWRADAIADAGEVILSTKTTGNAALPFVYIALLWNETGGVGKTLVGAALDAFKATLSDPRRA